MRYLRRLLAPLIGIVAVAATLVAACAGQAEAPVLNGAALHPLVNLPDVTFTRSDGGTFTSADARGRVSLFFFGYTHCADVCPLKLAELSQMRRTLGATARSVDTYFVTLDPARDTPDRMRAYMSNFPGVVGLIGSPRALAALQAAFGFQFQRQDLPNGDYAINHTAATYLVNAQSIIQLVYPNGTAPDDITADLRRLV